MAGPGPSSGVWKNPLPGQTSPQLEIVYESLSSWLASNVGSNVFTSGITVSGAQSSFSGGVLLDTLHATGNVQVDGNETVNGSVSAASVTATGNVASNGHYVPIVPFGFSQCQIQFGSSVVTTNSLGAATISFGTAFPNSLSAVIICDGDYSGAADVTVSVIASGSNASGFNLSATSNGTHLASSTVRINWVAFGF